MSDLLTGSVQANVGVFEHHRDVAIIYSQSGIVAVEGDSFRLECRRFIVLRSAKFFAMIDLLRPVARRRVQVELMKRCYFAYRELRAAPVDSHRRSSWRDRVYSSRKFTYRRVLSQSRATSSDLDISAGRRARRHHWLFRRWVAN